MNATTALDRLEDLLGQERDALRRMDIDAIEAHVVEKELLLASLQAALEDEGLEPLDRGDRRTVASRFARLVPALRHNGLLLAHGRDCLRDAIGAVVGESTRPAAGPGSKGPLVRPGSRISVTG